jgi:hypothetical protein
MFRRLAAPNPAPLKRALGVLIFRERGRARSWHGSLYRQRLGSGASVIVIWASTEGLTSVASKPILKIADAQMAFARMPCKKESPAVGRTHNQLSNQFVPVPHFELSEH